MMVRRLYFLQSGGLSLQRDVNAAKNITGLGDAVQERELCPVSKNPALCAGSIHI